MYIPLSSGSWGVGCTVVLWNVRPKEEVRRLRVLEIDPLVYGLWFMVYGWGLEVLGWGVWGLGFGFWVLGFGVWGLGLGVRNLGFGVSGLWLGVRAWGFTHERSRSSSGENLSLFGDRPSAIY